MGWGIGKDEAEAVKWWRQSAAQGDAGSENALGAAYRFGSGVSRDYSEAVKWFRMAAVHGDSLAQFNLGEMYLNGQGVAQNREEAKKWYKKSSVKGYKRSCEAYRKLNAARKSVSEIAAVPPEKRPLYLGIRSSHQKFFQRQPS
ncbi:MAG: sel1 repeat family protein [Chlorobiaceae bacterium]|nr:sel1 repeat family protein [Chlorobiaceae bacterium]